MNTLDLSDRRAVITGGGRGMGFATAKRFLESGALLCLWDISEETLVEAKAKLEGFGTVIVRRVDVSDYYDVETATQETLDRLGGIDILVNAAGIAGINVPLTDYPLATWNAVINVNLNGIFHTCRAVVPHMQKSNCGRIVNVSSMAGKDGNPNASAYSVSKAAVIGLTKSLGKQLATSNIRVNAIRPSVIMTKMLQDVSEEQLNYMLAKIPMGRAGTVEEVAAMVGWMCSEDCSYTTGAVFDLSGGRATY